MTDDNVTPIASRTKGARKPARGRPEGKDGGERGSSSMASQLVATARGRYDLFLSEDGRPYGVVKGGTNIALPLRGRSGLRSHLARLFTDAHAGAVPSASALADALTVLEGVAASTVPRKPWLRTAPYEGGVVIDLGDPEGRCVVVRPGSGWTVQSRSPVLFRRSGAMKPLPSPVRSGNGLDQLQGLLNMTEEDFRLLVAWLVAAFLPELPHPILAFRGEQGTGKSKAAAMVIGIVDPSGAPKRTAPRDVKAWATQAFNSWALCLDNVSTVPDWLSDALCRAVTGDGVVDRALYSDDDVVVLEFRRVLALTTIDAGALAGDLAERLVTIELETITDEARREEADLDQVYCDAHAHILAALLDLLAKVLEVLPDVVLEKRPRMADFARILAAVDKVTGWHTLSTYSETAQNAVADVVDSDQFAQAVIANQVEHGGIWEGTASELLAAVAGMLPEGRPPQGWPKDATRAGGRLKRLAPALRALGITLDESRDGRKRKITLSGMPPGGDKGPDGKSETTSPASPASRLGPTPPLTRANAAQGHDESASHRLEGLWAGDAAALGRDAEMTLLEAPASLAEIGSGLHRWPSGDAGVADSRLRPNVGVRT